MPDPRTNQTVAERLELQLERFPNPLHRRRRWFTLAGGLVPLLLLGVFAARGDHSIFLSQPVAHSHQYFQADCQTCHHTPWQPLIRLVSTNPTAKSVHDQACHQCHDQRKADHNVLAMAKGVPDCADCHLEHRGAIRLTDQADATCVRCHEPYENHPEFALLRRPSLDQEADAAAEATRHRLLPVARLQPVDDTPNAARGRWVDKTALKFSHQGHLAPLVARWRPGADETVPPQTTQLTCADCHELDANGQYMQPIVYEHHCQECHPLRFSSELDVADGPSLNERSHSLPHESPEIVRSVMRQRLVESAARLRQLPPAANPPSRLPNRQPTGGQQRWEWIAQELQILENAIFRVPNSDGTMHHSNACLKCHERAAVSSNGPSRFAIAPPEIPTRWMPQSHFRHDRHLKMQCTSCHHTALARKTATAAQPTGLDSKSVQDILMPSQAECQTCHGTTSGTRADFRPARSNCTECHQYHHVHISKAADEQAPH